MQTFDEAGWNARVETIPEKDPLKYLGPLALKNPGVAWDSMQTPLSCGDKSVKHLATGLMSRFGTVLMPGCRGNAVSANTTTSVFEANATNQQS